MAYTTIKKPSDYFNTKLYTGNGSTQAITSVNFQPDFTWLKRRDQTSFHYLFDSIRGVQKRLSSNSDTTEATVSTSLTSFDSDGFTLGSEGDVNESGGTYASWNWLASNTTASNTDGSITSTVSANTTSGFSIVSYTGNGTAGATIGHGLGTAPGMIITKTRSTARNWRVYHKGLGATFGMILNDTSIKDDDNTAWNDTEPTSSVFSVGTSVTTNDNGATMIAYCFADVKGFSKFGSYTGNGNADGTFIYTGFAPQYVLLKRTDSADGWWIIDNKQANPYPNPNVQLLVADTNGIDNSSVSPFIDILSNGFKLRSSWAGVNASGGSYIYMAFAEEPLVGDNPATAR